jgi:hypothetical protein
MASVLVRRRSGGEYSDDSVQEEGGEYSDYSAQEEEGVALTSVRRRGATSDFTLLTQGGQVLTSPGGLVQGEEDIDVEQAVEVAEDDESREPNQVEGVAKEVRNHLDNLSEKEPREESHEPPEASAG